MTFSNFLGSFEIVLVLDYNLNLYFFVSFVKTIPSVDALSFVQTNFLLLQNVSTEYFKEPTLRTIDLFILSFKPEMVPNLSIKLIKDSKVDLLFCTEIFASFLTNLYKIPMARRNKYGDNGHPCLTPLFILKKSDKWPLFETQLCASV